MGSDGKIRILTCESWIDAPSNLPEKQWFIFLFITTTTVVKYLSLLKERGCFPLLFGKSSDSDIQLKHGSCSEIHAKIRMKTNEEGEEYPAIVYMGSAYGTFVDGKRLSVGKYQPLVDGSIIKFGESTRNYVIMFR